MTHVGRDSNVFNIPPQIIFCSIISYIQHILIRNYVLARLTGGNYHFFEITRLPVPGALSSNKDKPRELRHKPY